MMLCGRFGYRKLYDLDYGCVYDAYVDCGFFGWSDFSIFVLEAKRVWHTKRRSLSKMYRYSTYIGFLQRIIGNAIVIKDKGQGTTNSNPLAW